MPKRRANGEGNIRKRKDGRWEGRYTAGHDPTTGKQIFKNVLGNTGGSQRQAEYRPGGIEADRCNRFRPDDHGRVA